MNLKSFLASLPFGGKKALAVKLGMSPAHLYQMSVGIRKIPVQLCKTLVEHDARMTLADLRPDLWGADIFGPAPKKSRAA